MITLKVNPKADVVSVQLPLRPGAEKLKRLFGVLREIPASVDVRKYLALGNALAGRPENLQQAILKPGQFISNVLPKPKLIRGTRTVWRGFLSRRLQDLEKLVQSHVPGVPTKPEPARLRSQPVHNALESDRIERAEAFFDMVLKQRALGGGKPPQRQGRAVLPGP